MYIQTIITYIFSTDIYSQLINRHHNSCRIIVASYAHLVALQIKLLSGIRKEYDKRAPKPTDKDIQFIVTQTALNLQGQHSCTHSQTVSHQLTLH